jgi:hypothetical protein
MIPADLRQLDTGQSGFVSFSSIDYGHPLFEGMFLKPPGDHRASLAVESPRIRAAAGLRQGPASLPIITMSDGRPFLCEYTAGKGRVFLFAVESGTAWSDFPFKGLYAPLMHRSMLYLASLDEPAETTRVGEPLRFSARLTAEEAGRGYRVRTPSGSEERVQPRELASSGMTIFQTQPTQETGIHLLISGEDASTRNQPLAAATVHSAAAESDLARVTDEALTAFWNRVGIPPTRVQHIASPDDVPRIVQESRFGVELWRYFVVLALACALVEMALARAGASTVHAEAHAHDSK